MNDRIEALIKKLQFERDIILDRWLTKLENTNVSDNPLHGFERIQDIALVHDLDKHITVLIMELKKNK